jgi:PST family polysaccharide transporter
MTDSPTLTTRGLKASFWAAFATYTTQAIRMAAMLYVAAMLTPDDFGLFSMAMAATGFFSISCILGISSSLIWNRDDPEIAAGTAFWMLIIGSLLTSFLIFSFSSTLSVFFHEPRLSLILKVVAFEPIVGMFTTVHFILLSRELRFKSKYWMGLISGLGGNCVLVTLACLGMGVWSFVASAYASILLASIYLFFFSGIRFPLRFNKGMAAKLLRFGIVAGFNNYLFFLLFNLDYVIVGKILNTAQLGYYSFAYRFANIPANYISQAVIGVAYPIFAMVKHDADKMLRGYVKGTHWLTMAVMPVAVILVLFGPDVMDQLYGTKWSPAYNAFRILCLYGLSEAIIAPVGSILYAAGKPSYQMYVNIFRIIAVVPLAVWGGSIAGIEGVAIVFTGVFLVAGILSIWLVKRVFGTSWMNLLKPILLTSFACIVASVASLTAKSFLPLQRGWFSIIFMLSLFFIVLSLTQYVIDKKFRSILKSIYRSSAEKFNYRFILNSRRK